MDFLSEIGQWIAENESLLSGMAALVVLAGVIFSPLGGGLRHMFVRKKHSQQTSAPVESSISEVPANEAVVSPKIASEPILAVLAFDNLSSDQEMQFFSDGVSEEIIQRLIRGAKLKVISRTSSFQFRGDQKADAAKQLNCSHILDGSIRRAEGRVRISCHLVDAVEHTTLWADRFDRELEDIFGLQDEISEHIASALSKAFSSFSTASVDTETYDLYLRASPSSYAPDELEEHVGNLELVTQRAPHFAEAWGRLAYLRGWLHFYQPFNSDRHKSIELVTREAAQALSLDPQNIEATAGQLFIIPPFGRFIEAIELLERIRRSPGSSDKRQYIGWYLRSAGWIRESLEEAERAYRLDELDPMSANLVALARLAAGQVSEAAHIYERLIVDEPDMSFPVSSLLRVYTFMQKWDKVDRLLLLAEKRHLREFEDGLSFIRTKRDPSSENIENWKQDLETNVKQRGCVELSRLVYTAHLGLVDEAYIAAKNARLGPTGTKHDIMGPDAYRTSLLFQADMPELRNDPRFPTLCARLGLVEFWIATDKWPDCINEVPYDLKSECKKLQQTPIEKFWP